MLGTVSMFIFVSNKHYKAPKLKVIVHVSLGSDIFILTSYAKTNIHVKDIQ